MECGLKIEIEEDGVILGVFCKGGKEKLFADFFSDRLVETLERILDWIEMPDGLKAKLYGKWVEQIGKKITKLDLDD